MRRRSFSFSSALILSLSAPTSARYCSFIMRSTSCLLRYAESTSRTPAEQQRPHSRSTVPACRPNTLASMHPLCCVYLCVLFEAVHGQALLLQLRRALALLLQRQLQQRLL